MVVQGVRQVDLAKGPGHYPNTADPGERGNAAFAGHRSGHGQPFAGFDRLRIGDLIEIETVNGVWRYRIDRPPERITPRQAWVVDPVPGQAIDAVPHDRRLTLTTCWPRYGSSHRMYVSALLVDGRRI
jgi:LPXTG-site transpeptidase (sortase) family protein